MTAPLQPHHLLSTFQVEPTTTDGDWPYRSQTFVVAHDDLSLELTVWPADPSLGIRLRHRGNLVYSLDTHHLATLHDEVHGSGAWLIGTWPAGRSVHDTVWIRAHPTIRIEHRSRPT